MKPTPLICLLPFLLAACSAAHEPAGPAGPADSSHPPFTRSEEIENPKSLTPGGAVMVRPDPAIPYFNYLPMLVHLPTETPYDPHSPEETAYLKGYALGYLDASCIRGECRSHVNDRALPGWDDGFEDGFQAATDKIKSEPKK